MKYKKSLIVLISLFIIDCILILMGLIDPIDDIVYEILMNLECDFITNFFKAMSFIASVYFIVLINIIIFIIMLIRKKYNLFIIIASSISSTLINNLLKIIIRRERPIINQLVNETSYSFPSGHSMIAVLFYGSILYLINKSNLKYKKVYNIIICMLIILIGLSRIYLGVHYFSDVVGGYLLSTIILLSLLNIRKDEK